KTETRPTYLSQRQRQRREGDRKRGTNSRGRSKGKGDEAMLAPQTGGHGTESRWDNAGPGQEVGSPTMAMEMQHEHQHHGPPLDQHPHPPPPPHPIVHEAVPHNVNLSDDLDIGTVRHLLSEAEMQQQQAEMHVSNSKSAVLVAQAQLDSAEAAYQETLQKHEDLKSRFRVQLMEEGLRQTSRWNDMYYKLVQWKEEHGNTLVPCESNSPADVVKLNRWVINQRSAYKYFMNGDKKHIKDHRIDALNKIGFIWSVTDYLWETNFEDLKRHHAETGTFEVVQKSNRKLSTFVSRLRTAMKNKKEGLVQQERKS
ncbi:hypothetical protein ACHAWF_005117, partial [Thalassiosira exigua]